MKPFHFILALALAVGLAAAVFPSLRSMADDGGCPSNSHPEYQTGNVVHCRCNEQFVARGGSCQLRAAVEDQLQQKVLQTLQAIKYTTDAINSERSGLIYTELRNNVASIGLAAGSALVVGNPQLLVPAALKLSADLGSALGQWGDCTATPSLRGECDNLHNYQKMLHDTATELYNLQHP